MLQRTITSDFLVSYILLFHTSICLKQGAFVMQSNRYALAPAASSANLQRNQFGFRLTLCSSPANEFKRRQRWTDTNATHGVSAALGTRGQATEQVASINRASAARPKQREIIKPSPRKQRQVDAVSLGILWNISREHSPTRPAQRRFIEKKSSKALCICRCIYLWQNWLTFQSFKAQ